MVGDKTSVLKLMVGLELTDVCKKLKSASFSFQMERNLMPTSRYESAVWVWSVRT